MARATAAIARAPGRRARGAMAPTLSGQGRAFFFLRPAAVPPVRVVRVGLGGGGCAGGAPPAAPPAAGCACAPPRAADPSTRAAGGVNPAGGGMSESIPSSISLR